MALSALVDRPRLPRAGWALSREGRVWLCIVALVLLVGVIKNINLLALLGYVLLALLVLAGILVGRRLGRLEARRVLDENLFAGTAIRLEVRVHNTSTRPVLGVCIEDIGTAHSARWYFDQFEPNDRQMLTAEILLPRRGWYDFAPLAASSTYPFGLWSRRIRIGLPQRVLVLPRPGKILRDRLRHHLRGADPRGERVHRHGWRHEAAQADFHGLRPFRTGDSPRWIHWRTSARRGELMVREFEDVPGDDLALFVDTRADEEARESVIQLAATIVEEWNQRRGDRVLMLVLGSERGMIEGVTGPEHCRALLECLALVNSPGESIGLALHAEQVPASMGIMVLAAHTSDLPAQLEATLGRPVALLTPTQLRLAGVYTPP